MVILPRHRFRRLPHGFGNPSSLNPVCGGALNSVATGGNSDPCRSARKISKPRTATIFGRHASQRRRVRLERERPALPGDGSDHQRRSPTGRSSGFSARSPPSNGSADRDTRGGERCPRPRADRHFNASTALSVASTSPPASGYQPGRARLSMTSSLRNSSANPRRCRSPTSTCSTAAKILKIPLQKGSIAFDYTISRVEGQAGEIL